MNVTSPLIANKILQTYYQISGSPQRDFNALISPSSQALASQEQLTNAMLLQQMNMTVSFTNRSSARSPMFSSVSKQALDQKKFEKFQNLLMKHNSPNPILGGRNGGPQHRKTNSVMTV